MRKSAQGYTLVEVLMASSILAILFVAIGIMLNVASENVGRNRALKTAHGLAQDQIETIRAMTYTDVGTVGGVPNGVLNQTQIVPINNVDYTITTTIVYVDDPYDDLEPVDTTPTDYKRARVAVSWGGAFASKNPLVLWTDTAPNGRETDIAGGTIEIAVFDASGIAVSGASVQLDAPTASPSVSVALVTDVDGKVVLPGAPVCTECYRVSVTKAGYTSERTYNHIEVANPARPDLTVLESEKTSTSFTIDVLSSVTFRATRGAAFNYSTFQGVQFRILGNKLIGRTAADDPVYKTDRLATTALGGVVTVSQLEWDTYTLMLPAGSVVDFAGSSPFSPFSVTPGSNMTVHFVVAAATPNTYLLKIMDNLQHMVASASVTISNPPLGFLATAAAGLSPRGDQAQTFFSNLPSTTLPYHIAVDSFGYLPASSDATVSGDVIEQLILTPE